MRPSLLIVGSAATRKPRLHLNYTNAALHDSRSRQLAGAATPASCTVIINLIQSMFVHKTVLMTPSCCTAATKNTVGSQRNVVVDGVWHRGIKRQWLVQSATKNFPMHQHVVLLRAVHTSPDSPGRKFCNRVNRSLALPPRRLMLAGRYSIMMLCIPTEC